MRRITTIGDDPHIRLVRQAWLERHSYSDIAAQLTAISGYAFPDLHSNKSGDPRARTGFGSGPNNNGGFACNMIQRPAGHRRTLGRGRPAYRMFSSSTTIR
jgi:hypothetical protein